MDELKGRVEQEEVEISLEEIEGYAYCDTRKQKCLNDCYWPDYGPKKSMLQ